VLAVCMPMQRVPAQAGLLLQVVQSGADVARSVSRALKATRHMANLSLAACD
jgi:hypothetical protein